MATLQEPDSGRILLDGRDVLADPQAHRLRLGYLPQEFGVYPGVSAAALLDHLALLKDVRQLCPRVAILSEGRVLLEGEPDMDLSIVVDQRPAYVAIDPQLRRIDRNPDNNVRRVEESPSP